MRNDILSFVADLLSLNTAIEGNLGDFLAHSFVYGISLNKALEISRFYGFDDNFVDIADI